MKVKNYKSKAASFLITIFELYLDDQLIKTYGCEKGEEEAEKLAKEGYVYRDVYLINKVLPKVEEEVLSLFPDKQSKKKVIKDVQDNALFTNNEQSKKEQ